MLYMTKFCLGAFWFLVESSEYNFSPHKFSHFFCTSTSIKVLFQILQKLRFSYSTSATDTFG